MVFLVYTSKILSVFVCNHFSFILKFVKFLKVPNERPFRSDGLSHIIDAEESTNFIVNFEDS